MSLEIVRSRFPAVYQWLYERVKPERDQNNRASYKENWWIFGEARRDWRLMAGELSKFVITVKTAKHRISLLSG